jgi:hypothetical protein
LFKIDSLFNIIIFGYVMGGKDFNDVLPTVVNLVADSGIWQNAF